MSEHEHGYEKAVIDALRILLYRTRNLHKLDSVLERITTMSDDIASVQAAVAALISTATQSVQRLDDLETAINNLKQQASGGALIKPGDLASIADEINAAKSQLADALTRDPAPAAPAPAPVPTPTPAPATAPATAPVAATASATDSASATVAPAPAPSADVTAAPAAAPPAAPAATGG